VLFRSNINVLTARLIQSVTSKTHVYKNRSQNVTAKLSSEVGLKQNTARQIR